MKAFSILALSALVALVAAAPQTESTTTATLSPQASCALKCPGDDICCKAKCVEVPCPNEAMANKTTECARGCSQGNGSPADTEAYGRCQLACISSYFFTGTATLPAATGTSPPSQSGTATSSGGSAGGSGSQTASATSSGGAAPKSSGGAANVQYQLGSTAAGIIGLVMALFAL